MSEATPQSSSSPPLRLERRGAVEIVTLDRPATLNAIDVEMATALSAYFEAARAQPEVRVIVLRAEGKCFSAGADLDSAAFAAPGPGRAQRQLEMQKLYSGIIRHMRACPQPILALVQGAACGGGFSLLLAADIRYATPHAKMNAAYLRIGLGGADMGSSYLLPRLVGVSVASEYLLTGRFMTAERALAVGLVSQVVAPEELLATGLATAEEMLKASPLGLRLTKETLNASIDAPSLDAALLLEDRQQVLLLETADHREAVAAFKERRSPEYGDR
jgi:enoyl-CoA hydratase/carnithine racemase